MAWPKGLGELFKMMAYVQKRSAVCSTLLNICYFWNRTGRSFPVDIYGTGPHWEDIRQTARKMELPVCIFRFISLDIIY